MPICSSTSVGVTPDATARPSPRYRSTNQLCKLALDNGVSRLNSDDKSPWLAVCRWPLVSAPS